MSDLAQQIREQLEEAYARINGRTPPEVVKNIYKSLTYHWLYEPAPRGFTEALRFGEEYVRNPRRLPSGGLWVNLACAYSQRAKWRRDQGDIEAPDAATRKNVIEAITKAVELDPAWGPKLQFLLRTDLPAKIGTSAEAVSHRAENDLEIFEDDAEIRVLLGLPANRSNAMSLSKITVFRGRCDASGGIAVDDTQWIGANDEENILRVYSRDGGLPLNDNLLSLDGALGIASDAKHGEADLESAARLGDLIFWIGSHSQSKEGKDRPNRHCLVASKLETTTTGAIRLSVVGSPCRTLREELVKHGLPGVDLAKAITLPPKQEGGFNIESICADAGDNLLWIGLRNPIAPAGAVLIPLQSPRPVVEAGATPIFGTPEFVDLGGLGFRDMVKSGNGYIILAGDFRDRADADARPSELYSWGGPGTKAEKIALSFGDLNPEALVAFPDNSVLILSDDGTRPTSDGVTCKDALPDLRSFRGVWWKPPVSAPQPGAQIPTT